MSDDVLLPGLVVEVESAERVVHQEFSECGWQVYAVVYSMAVRAVRSPQKFHDYSESALEEAADKFSKGIHLAIRGSIAHKSEFPNLPGWIKELKPGRYNGEVVVEEEGIKPKEIEQWFRRSFAEYLAQNYVQCPACGSWKRRCAD